MMIFAHTWQAVLNGTKTQTRRVVQDGESYIWEASTIGKLNELMGANPPNNPYDAHHSHYINQDTIVIQQICSPNRNNRPVYNRILKWQVGRTYAVVPKMSYPAVMWRHDPAKFSIAHNRVYGVSAKDWKAVHLESGWQEARILLTAIRQEWVQDISEEDAIAEGCKSDLCRHCAGGDCAWCGGTGEITARQQYEKLWDSINTKPGTRWDDNPLVWVLEFELIEEKE